MFTHLRVGTAKLVQSMLDSMSCKWGNFDGDCFPISEQTMLKLAEIWRHSLLWHESRQGRVGLTSYANELLGLHGDKLLLKEACAATLYTIEILVNLIRAVKGRIEHDSLW